MCTCTCNYYNNYIPVVLVVVSRNLEMYIFFVLQCIPVSVTGCLKRILGSQDKSANTVTRQDGGMGSSIVPNRSASLFRSYSDNVMSICTAV